MGLPNRSPQGLISLLRNRSLGFYIFGNTLTNMGTWVKDVAAAIYLYHLTGSAVVVAGVALAGYGSAVVLSPLGGVLADRVDRLRLLAVLHLAQASAAFALAAVVSWGEPSVGVVLGLLLAIGIGKALVMPALHAVLPSIIEARDLAPALTLQSLTFNGTRAVGPLAGALIATGLDPSAAFAINGIAFLSFVACLPFISLQDGGFVESPQARSRTVVVAAFKDRRIRLLLLGMAVAGMVTDPLLTLGPAFAESLSVGQAFAGGLVAAFGTGSLLAAPLVQFTRRRVGPVRAGGIGLMAVFIGFGAIAASPSPQTALLGAALAGAGFLVASTDFTAAMQAILPTHLRGRVMALWTVAYFGSRPIAAVVSGAVSDAYGPNLGMLPVMAVAGGMALIAYLMSKQSDLVTPIRVVAT